MVKRPFPYSAFNNSVPLKIVKFIEKNKKKIHEIRQNHSVFRVHGIRQLGMANLPRFCKLVNFCFSFHL